MYEDMQLPPDYLNTSAAEYERIKALPLEQRMAEYEKLAAKTRESLSQSDDVIETLWEDKLESDVDSKNVSTAFMASLRAKL